MTESSSHALPMPRRTFLKGIGTAIALPMLDAMLPARLITGSAFGAGAKKTEPNRMVFIYVPNGIRMKSWTPSMTGSSFDLPPILEELKPFRAEILLLSGLTEDKGRANGDGAGDHARAAAAFLTGAQPVKTRGANIKVGVSVDQVAAARVGHATRFASLELGCERGGQAGDCDSGYSCAYSNSISWKTPSMPMAKEVDPRLLFERLFPSIGTKEGRLRGLFQKSILDFVLEDAKKLGSRLGATDRRKLEEYLASIREIETRLERSEKESKAKRSDEPPPPGAAKLASTLPPGVPADFGEHIRLMSDILVLAFQADLTRIATFMIANEGSNRSYRDIGVPEGHHDLSHHGNEKAKEEKIEKINRFHIAQFAHFLKKLKGTRDGAGTLLDHSMVLYGSGISDGNRHDHHELPILVAGKGGGSIQPGRHIRYPKNTPLNNLHLSLLDRMEVSEEALGDSNARLKDLGS